MFSHENVFCRLPVEGGFSLLSGLWVLGRPCDCWVLLLLLQGEFEDGVMQGCGDAGQRPQLLCSLGLLKRQCLTEDTDLHRKLEPTRDHLVQWLYTAQA